MHFKPSFLLALLLLLVPISVGAQEPEVRPGDQIVLRIVQEPEMSGTYTVSTSGDVALPVIGRFAVAGRPAASVQEAIRNAYAEFLRDPSLEVSVLRRVAVVGEVHRPDLYMAELNMSVADLLARAGGVTAFGTPRRISVVSAGAETRIEPDELSLLRVVSLHSGDQVVVGRRSWLSLNALNLIGTGAVVISVTPIILSFLRSQ